MVNTKHRLESVVPWVSICLRSRKIRWETYWCPPTLCVFFFGRFQVFFPPVKPRIMALQTALLLLPLDQLPNFKASAQVQARLGRVLRWAMKKKVTLKWDVLVGNISITTIDRVSGFYHYKDLIWFDGGLNYQRYMNYRGVGFDRGFKYQRYLFIFWERKSVIKSDEISILYLANVVTPKTHEQSTHDLPELGARLTLPKWEVLTYHNRELTPRLLAFGLRT